VASAGPYAPRSRQITMPVPHLSFYRPGALLAAQPTASNFLRNWMIKTVLERQVLSKWKYRHNLSHSLNDITIELADCKVKIVWFVLPVSIAELFLCHLQCYMLVKWSAKKLNNFHSILRFAFSSLIWNQYLWGNCILGIKCMAVEKFQFYLTLQLYLIWR